MQLESNVRCSTGCRVLIVDDDIDFTESMSDILEYNDYQVVTATSIPTAEDAAREFCPAVALLDVRLGTSSGVTLLDSLTTITPGIVCMMITAYAGTDAAVKSLRKNAYDFLRKPIEPEDLLGALHRCFEKRKLELERRVAEMALRSSEERYRKLYQENPAMFFTVGLQNELLSVNRYGAEQLGYTESDLVGKPLSTIIHPDDQLQISQDLAQCFEDPGVVNRWEVRKTNKNGETIWVRESARTIGDENGDDCALVVAEDITEARILSERLSYEAAHDVLTGLFNRREFEQKIRHLLGEVRHENSSHVLCYLDLDQFKIVNDTCGHVAGDAMLREISDLLSKKVRRSDSLSRLGGDEFAVLMENCPLNVGCRLATELLDAIRDYRFVWETRTFSVSASIGIVVVDKHSESYGEVLKDADSACYLAKDHGRNRIHVFNNEDADVSKRLGEMEWVGTINQALELDRFELYAQRLGYIGGDDVVGEHYEVLLRLRDDRDRIVLPGAFLPAAERYGLSSKIDIWVFNKTLNMVAPHADRIAMCAINLSGNTLCDEEALKRIEATLADSSVSPEKICFEVTETAAIANVTDAANFINRMRALGCRFALDDFGSGFSSFAYLKNLKVDFLKIDGQFVKDIRKNPVDLAMVKSINEVGHVMNIRTIAEFVQDAESIEILKEIQIDYIQGYFFDTPAPLCDYLDELPD